ncbi:MAG: putative bifunctional diguanylate cyclase/phosphodiesterase [Solirubrobacteraceae bacterium]
MARDHGGSKPARVLLVEEDPRSAMMIMEMLRAVWPQGLLITQAQNVADAAREVADHGSSCVLLDLPRQQTEPLAALEQLSAAAPTTPIIVLSEYSDVELGVSAVRGGAQDYLLASELNPAALLRAVRYAVERKRSEVELARQALHDPLTTLPNRALFLDRLSGALDRSQRTGAAVCLLFLDVDAFKVVNDTLGHGAGDTLLIVLADRFRGLLRPMDTVARFGGDEFTFLLEGLGSEREAMLIAERISHSASLPLALGEAETSVAVSIGISMVTDAATSIEEAIRDADAAMYRAKELGGSRFELFDERSRRRSSARSSLESSLRTALERSQLRIHYQPRVSINGETGLVGFEALVRWQHPERGLMAPGEFMGLAEESGLIVPIGEWVIAQALAQVHDWRQSRPGMSISVNLSARQLAQPDLVDRLQRAIEASGADPGVLWLEVTEDTVQQDPAAVIAALTALRELGVKIAIDDFGMGHSSLQSLRSMPIDMLKIHQSFVGGLDADPDDSAIVGAVVELGHALGLSVIAEGVETDAQLAHLRELGCDGAQGFLFSQPVPEDDVHELLVSR